MLREWQSYDRFLRLRWSLDEPGQFILERKTRYLDDYPFRRGTDRQVQLKDDYRRVVLVEPRELEFVHAHLRRTDIQRLGGAKLLAARMQQTEDTWESAQDRAMQAVFDTAGGEAYERLAWLEGRRVAGGFGL